MRHPYVEFCARRYAIPLTIALMISALGLAASGRVTLDPSTTSLLPRDTPTLAALRELEERVPGASRAYFLIQSGDPAFNVAASERIRDEVAGWEEVRWALSRRDPRALMHRRLQLLPERELERLADDVEAIVDWEECARLPGCINLDTCPETPTEESLDARFMAVPEISSLVRYLGRDSVFEARDEARRASVLPEGALCSETGEVCAVEVNLERSASDLSYAIEIFDRGEALLETIDLGERPPDLKTAFAGAYRDAPLTRRVMTRDLQVTSWVSSFLVLAWLLFQFRGIRPLLLIVLPLATSVLATLAIVGFFRLELNVVSAFTFAILVGIGVDFGFHLLMQYGDQRRAGAGVMEALGTSMVALRGSMFTAAFTTVFVFGMLSFADFRGLSQLGVIAAVGVVLAVTAYRLLIPPLVIAANRAVPERRSISREHAWVKTGLLGPRGAKVFAIAFVVFAGVMGYVGKDARFEYDFRRLNPKEIQHGIASGETMHGASGVPVYILANEVEEAARIAREVEASLAERFAPKDKILALSLATFIPPDVEARVTQVNRMKDALERVYGTLGEEERARLGQLRDLLEYTDPITMEMLPPYVRDVFVERDGTPGGFAVVYVRVSGSDAVLMEELSGHIQGFRERFEGVRFASPPAVVGEIMPSLRADGPKVLGVTLLGLFLVTWVASRSIRRSVLVLAPIVLGSAVALGLLALFDVRINFYNMLIIPVSYGIGIDGAIYVAWAMEGDGGTRLARLTTARRAVIASSFTTMGAFSSFVLANNPGLASLGYAALIIFGALLFATVLWLPAVYVARGSAR